MHIVVTGGAGFIGANLCRRLITEPGVTRLTVVDDLSSGSRDNLAGLGTHLVEASILDQAVMDAVLGRADAVVHLAARPSVLRSLDDPRQTHEVNATGTLAVLEAVRRHPGAYLVVASSSSVYGRAARLPVNEDTAPAPASPYAASKVAAEGYVRAHASAFGIDSLVFRFFNVYGPLQSSGHVYAAVVPTFIDRALRGLPLEVHGDGAQTRDFTYVDTVTAVIADALRRRVTAAAPVNLAAGAPTSVLELAHQVDQVLGTRSPVRHQPPRGGDIHDSHADPSRLDALFPGVAWTSLAAGLRATADWRMGQFAA